MEINKLLKNIDEYYKSVFEIANRCKEVGLVIYGAGFWGMQTYRIFHKLSVTPFVRMTTWKNRSDISRRMEM